MRRLPIIVGIVLIVAHAAGEFHEWFKISTRYIHPFISDEYAAAHPAGIKLNWWVVYCATDFLLIGVHVILVMLASRISRKLTTICGLYLLYHLFDHFFLWYDYKTNHSLYLIENITTAACVIALCWPSKLRVVP